jgi:hypothetical protein
MSNETRYSYLVDASAALAAISGTVNLASNSFNASTEVTSQASGSNSFYPLADLYFTGSFSTSISSASNLMNIYRRDKSIDGSHDAPQPQSAAPAYSAIGVGGFIVPPFTAGSISCALFLPDVPLSDQYEFYLENKTNAILLSGYVVKVRPKTFTPAP